MHWIMLFPIISRKTAKCRSGLSWQTVPITLPSEAVHATNGVERAEKPTTDGKKPSPGAETEQVSRPGVRSPVAAPGAARSDTAEQQRRDSRGALLAHPDPAARSAAHRPRSVAATIGARTGCAARKGRVQERRRTATKPNRGAVAQPAVAPGDASGGPKSAGSDCHNALRAARPGIHAEENDAQYIARLRPDCRGRKTAHGEHA
jgi:hypothetical protein